MEILEAFGSYVDALGTQPLTLPLHELVLEMIASYQTVTSNLEPFTWATRNDPACLIPVLEEFIRSQEIFFFPDSREPVLEIAFSVRKWGMQSLDLEFCVSWNPTLVSFEGLTNVVTEGRDFRECSSIRALGGLLSWPFEYFVWLGSC